MKPLPSLEDLIGLEYSKLGFFREAQEKIAQLHASTLELERRRQQIQAIVDGLTDTMPVITPEGRITSVNRVYYEVYGGSSPVGQLCYKVFRKAHEPCRPCPADIAFRANRVCRREHIYSVGEATRHFEITASPLRDPQGRPCHILLLKRDVTVEREYQAELHQAEKMSTVGLLAAGVAHEINNPLTAIVGFAHAIRKRLPDLKDRLPVDFEADLRESMDIILNECARCQEIVQGLLSFSRPHSGTMVAVNLNDCVRETLRLMQHKIKQYPHITLRYEPMEPLPLIRATPSEIKQLLLNLLLNAMDALVERRGIIEVRTGIRDDERVFLAVRDNGCGIVEENRGKIFDPFFTTKPIGQGTGMGLSLCYSIAQAHDASMEVESRPGEGSVFRVVFRKMS
ncbi:MAG: PAS domain-containing sensor histidine kinase [Desulfosoma sp.]|uniref:PAS domain-containing sensor histidine kinase n=1 Tax=Desulfosoma sp. TaxID=2603217 RepID=UPI004048F5DC